MGKRFVLSAVILATITVSAVGKTAQGPSTSAWDSIYALHTQAQGLSTSSLQASGSQFSLDSVIESPTIVSHAPVTAAAQTQVLDVWVTAYTSHPSETDDTPFITATGSNVRDGVAAANFLPIGTKFRVPKVFGDKVFTVEDRMNARYNDVQIVDLWFNDRSEAISFGKKTLAIELL